jgi:hypothetical protein
MNWVPGSSCTARECPGNPPFQGVRAAGPQSAAAAQERRHKCGLKAPDGLSWAPASAAVR